MFNNFTMTQIILIFIFLFLVGTTFSNGAALTFAAKANNESQSDLNIAGTQWMIASKIVIYIFVLGGIYMLISYFKPEYA